MGLEQVGRVKANALGRLSEEHPGFRFDSTSGETTPAQSLLDTAHQSTVVHSTTGGSRMAHLHPQPRQRCRMRKCPATRATIFSKLPCFHAPVMIEPPLRFSFLNGLSHDHPPSSKSLLFCASKSTSTRADNLPP